MESLSERIRNDDTFRNNMCTNMPQKSEFVSSSSFPPFSKQNPFLVPPSNGRGLYSALLADMFFRFCAAKKSETQLTFPIAELTVLNYEHMLEISENMDESPKNRDRVMALRNAFDEYRAYLNQVSDLDSKTITYLCFMAQMEMPYRSGRVLDDWFVMTIPGDDIKEATEMLKLFENNVPISGRTVINPLFIPSHMFYLRNTYGDLYTNGMLIQFNPTANIGYSNRDIAGLGALCRMNRDLEIERVGIYFSRYGVLSHAAVKGG